MKSMVIDNVHSKSGVAKPRTRVDVISSTPDGGKVINVRSGADSEFRDVKTMSPYGISSLAVEGMMIQVMINDGNITIVGVYDPSKPDVAPGETIIYSKYGQRIELKADGNIVLIPADGKKVIMGQLDVDTINAEHIICTDIQSG